MKSNTPLKELTFTVFDVETTGFGFDKAEIIEISAVQIKPGFLLELNSCFSELVRPRVPIDNSSRIHNITEEMVKDKPFIENVLPSFFKYAENTVAAGHNVKNFDMRFIKKAADKNLFKLPFIEVIDTLTLTKWLYKDVANYKLSTITQYLNINVTSLPKGKDGVSLPVMSHRALFDATCTAMILKKCLEALDGKGLRTVSDLKKHKLL